MNVDKLFHLTGQQLAEGVQQVWSDLKLIGDGIMSQLQLLDEQISSLIIPPKLPVPASKQDCLDALHKFHKHISVALREHKILKQKLSDHAFDVQQLRQITEEGGFEVHAQVVEQHEKIGQSIWGGWSDTSTNCVYTLELEGQSDELKSWWREEVFNGSHVERQVQTRDVLEISRDAYSSLLPAEIMSAIYSAASLETCCVLRQVSKAWYAEFEQSHVMRPELRARNPWIKPGKDDLRSWQDCVLVFVARLKWSTTELLTNVHVTKETSECRLVIPTVLKLGETLPGSFEPMFPGSDTFRTWSGNDLYTVNVKTMEMTDDAVEYTVEYTGADKTVVKCKGIEISLPPGLDPRNVIVEEDMIMVGVEQGTVLLPRDNPVMENAFLVDKTLGIFFTLGSILVLQTSHSYEFVDLESRQTVKYCTYSPETTPMAAYNGAVWFQVEDKFVPTFMDLKTETLYYKPDRIFTGLAVDTELLCGSSHFIHNCAEEIIDVVSGERTKLVLPNGWSWRGELFWGFVNGVFKVYCMSAEHASETKAAMREKYGIDDDIYDM